MTPQRVRQGWAWPGEAAAAAWLASLGLHAGDRVACGLLNHERTVPLLCAALRLGLTVVPFNRRLSAAELTVQLAHARTGLAIADDGHPLAAVTSCRTPPACDGPAGGGGELRGSLVLFTSGTTGSPKAARLGPDCIAAAVAAHVTALRLNAADRWSLPLPLDHVGGIMAVLRCRHSGCSLDLAATPGADATGTSIVPTQLARLVAAQTPPPAGLRLALTGGGPLDPALADAARRLGWPVHETYGLTEMGSMVTLDGVPVPGAQLRIDNGRILVGGAMRFDGYEADGALEPADVWHRTGDLGELADGRLRVTGRQAELIVSGGENVAATEVETVLAENPAIIEAGVIGLPDAEWGEVVAAAIVLRDATPIAEIEAWLAPRLAGFKRPRRWRIVEVLPRTALGKLRRAALRELFP